MPISIAPWIIVNDGEAALEFYTSGFGAIPTYRLEDPDAGLIARLSIEGAEFWISGDSTHPISDTKGAPIRMILTVPNPDEVFANALKAGATEIFPVGEGHGWRLGRLADPFGYHWEIGYELSPK